jgi:hypothetical protein
MSIRSRLVATLAGAAMLAGSLGDASALTLPTPSLEQAYNASFQIEHAYWCRWGCHPGWGYRRWGYGGGWGYRRYGWGPGWGGCMRRVWGPWGWHWARVC